MKIKTLPFAKNGFILPVTIMFIVGASAIAVGTLYSGQMVNATGVNIKNKIRTFHAADGLMTLLAQELLNGNQGKYLDTTSYGFIFGEVWSSCAGNTVASLKSCISAQPVPNRIDTSRYLGSNYNANGYGIRWRGYLTPPFTGNYKFYVRTDAAGLFRLSSDTTYANLAPICSITTNTQMWPDTGGGISKFITLKAGLRYKFEFFHKEDTGSDHGQIGWIGPEYLDEKPITGSYISNSATGTQFSGVDTLGNLPVKFTISSAGLNSYSLTTDAILTKPGSATDTAFRAPLNQRISMNGAATKPPDSVFLPVIYYDYRADGSNPEFQSSYPSHHPGNIPLTKRLYPKPYLQSGGTLTTGLVQATSLRYLKSDSLPASHFTHFRMDSIPKLKRSLTKARVTCGIDQWFRPWSLLPDARKRKQPKYRRSTSSTWPLASTSNEGWYQDSLYYYRTGSTATKYKYSMGMPCEDSVTTSPTVNDTAMKNIVLLDSLVFKRQTNGTYLFSNSKNFAPSAMFYPLDSKGFGKDHFNITTNAHNWGFCVEMHVPFVHRSGLVWTFGGDDDYWVFVNDSLVIDKGYTHNELNGSIDLDDLTSLTFGKTYWIHMYLCERNATDSNLRIITTLPVSRATAKAVASWKRDYGSVD